jgi:hypothetical protein
VQHRGLRLVWTASGRRRADNPLKTPKAMGRIAPYQPDRAMNESSTSPGPDPARGVHLDSWKEIAAYLKRDIRTVQRWEKQEGLPVHRHQHDERATTYAYSAEIDRWLAARRTNGTVARGSDAARVVSEPTTRQDLQQEEVSPPSDRKTTSTRAVSLTWAIGGIATVIAAVVIWASWPAAEQPRPLSTLSVVFPSSQQFREWGPDLALSPDGTTVVYANSAELGVRRLDQEETRVIPGTAVNSWGPFFSPDGSTIGFFAPGKLLKVPIGGGVPIVLTEINVDFVGGADWGPNDEIVYSTPTAEGSHGLYRVPARGGTAQVIATLDGQTETAYWLTPQWINGGSHVLCTVARSSPEGTRFQAVTVSVASGEQQLLLDDARHARDVGNGILVYWRDDALFAVSFDSKRLDVDGPHVPAGDNVGWRVRNRSWANATNTLVYWPNVRRDGRLVWVDRDGHEQPLPLQPGKYHGPRLSPDGRSAAVIVGGEFGNAWRYDLGTGVGIQLTQGDRTGALAWAEDGTSLIVAMREGGGNELYRISPDGTGDPERLVNLSGFRSGTQKQPVGWTGSGGTLVFYQYGMKQEPAFWAANLRLSDAPRAISLDGHGQWGGSVSPDGRWLAYADQRSNRSELFVSALPSGRPQWQVTTDGGRLPRWARSGREIFYWRGRRLMALPVTTDETFVPGEPRPLFEGDYFEMQHGEPNYDVSLDDQRLLFVQRGATDGPERLNVVQGWRSEIERRLREAR